MAHYLVIHTPKDAADENVLPPTKLSDLARQLGVDDSRPRWIRTWSPDLHDDRIFSYWEAASADEIMTAMEQFGFLNDMDAHPVNVREWGPADVLEVDSE